ncbi:MAG: hypothetical protein RLZZ335_968 [Bacteroidota bacterium]
MPWFTALCQLFSLFLQLPHFFGIGAFFLAEVVKLVDTHVSGACVARHAGSSPAFGT